MDLDEMTGIYNMNSFSGDDWKQGFPFSDIREKEIARMEIEAVANKSWL